MLLNNLVDSKNKLKLVRILCLHKDEEFIIKELEIKTGIHRVRISNLIKEFDNQRVINIKKKGKIRLVSINKDNYFVREFLIKMFKEENNIAEDAVAGFINKLAPKKNVISLILYGSAVKKNFTFSSDIDIMIIYKDKIKKDILEKQVEDYSKKGINISYDFIKKREFKRLYSEKEPVIRSIVKNHKILYGKNLLEMI